MTTSTNIKLNIVAPDAPAPAPVDPAVPNTGLFTHGIGAPEATIIVSVVLILAIVGIILAAYMYRKHKKADKVTKLVYIIDQTKAVVKSKKRITAGLAAIALLVSAGTLIALAKNGVNATDTDNQAEDENDNSLTVDVSSEELTIELADDPVFAVLPVEVTVEEATDLGYTLTAYTDSTDLVSTTDSSNTIPMVTVDTTDIEEANETEETNEVEASDSSTLVPLSPNTYGLSFTNPESVLDSVFTSLSTDSTAPTLITDKAYEATEANDTTTIYYGFYITPDMPKGTYVSNSEVVYDAIPNLATVTYDANGLYYNNDESLTTNTLGYKPNVAEAPIELVTGEYLTPAPLNPDSSSSIHYTFLGWSEDKDATEATYVDEQDILANLTLTKNESLTLYAVWHYDTVLSFNGNTSDSGTMAPITIAGGTTSNLPTNSFTKNNCIFTGWNTDMSGTGISYGNSSPYTASATAKEEFTLYAQWQCISQVNYYGNGATSGQMSSSVVLGGSTLTLPQNTFTKDGYVFNGWNTQADGTGTSYSDQGTFTAPMSPATTLNLYAQWMQPTMQNVALWGSTLSQGDTMQVPDTRDGKSYWVAKLADGNIWMTQNLDLDIDSTKTYTPADTDIPANWTPVRSTTNSTTWDTSTTGRTVPHSYDPGNLYWNGNVTTSSGTLSNRTTTDPSATSGGTHYHVGNYYNWTAAVAMNNSSAYTSNQQDVNQSICPAGWRLPTYSGDKSYLNLKNAQGLTSGTSGNIQNAPTYFVYGSGWDGSSADVGFGGRYWSSVVGSSSGSYRLYFSASGGLSPRDSSGRDNGYSLRCVAR